MLDKNYTKGSSSNMITSSESWDHKLSKDILLNTLREYLQVVEDKFELKKIRKKINKISREDNFWGSL